MLPFTVTSLASPSPSPSPASIPGIIGVTGTLCNGTANLTIAGTNFTNGTILFINGLPIVSTFVNSGELTANVAESIGIR
jgi:hypothetical protein